MPNYNSMCIVGNLTRDPELRFTPNGSAVANFALAVNRSWTDESGAKKEVVTFIDVTVWGKTAENCAKYLRKGRPALVSGRLESQEWTDKASGQKRSKLILVAEQVQFLGSNDGASGTAARTATKPSETAPTSAPVAGDGPPESDDVPF